LFKFELSKSLNPKFNYLFFNLEVYSLLRFLLKKEALNREFIIYYMCYEFLTNFSYRNLKQWVSHPINPLCKKEYQMSPDILSNEFNIIRHQRFLTNHFLQNIYYLLENCLHTKLIKLGNKNIPSIMRQDEFLSNENTDNIRGFFEFIIKNMKKENDKIQERLNLKQKGSGFKNFIASTKEVKLN